MRLLCFKNQTNQPNSVDACSIPPQLYENILVFCIRKSETTYYINYFAATPNTK
jgi:hypothetical protein